MSGNKILRNSFGWRSELKNYICQSEFSLNINSSNLLLSLICLFNPKLSAYFNRFNIFIDNNFEINKENEILSLITMMIKSKSKNGLVTLENDIFCSKLVLIKNYSNLKILLLKPISKDYLT